MDPMRIIDTYYYNNDALRDILVRHSRAVAAKALDVVDRHPELGLDRQFVAEAAMLHDIGIFLTDAPSICCHGTYPYICHGYLGADLMRSLGYDRHALVCERHTGAGISLQTIIDKDLPLPHRDLRPVSMEEQVVCYADKFFFQDIPGQGEECGACLAQHLQVRRGGCRTFHDLAAVVWLMAEVVKWMTGRVIFDYNP